MFLGELPQEQKPLSVAAVPVGQALRRPLRAVLSFLLQHRQSWLLSLPCRGSWLDAFGILNLFILEELNFPGK